jgi:hypothetical protein
MDDLAEASIWTGRLVLRPLRVADAEEMVGVLGDPALHEFIGGWPLGLEELRRRYAAMVAGPGRPGEVWRNWGRAAAGRHGRGRDRAGHPDHSASARVAVAAGLVATAEVADGEWVWRRQGRGPGPPPLRAGG